MHNTRLGIIGGGQLGMLLIQSAIQFPIHVSVYDPNPKCPASHYTDNFSEGGFDDVDRIVEFGAKCDVVIFETESTSVEALEALEQKGVKVFSRAADLKWIKDKLVQRKKLAEAGFPVPEFQEVAGEDVRSYAGGFPIVQKWRKGGYDGMGVQIHEDAESLAGAAEVDSIMEEKVKIEMEISVIVARDAGEKMETYEPVEMTFKAGANLVDYAVCPARISQELAVEAKELCEKIAADFGFVGVYAFELFITKGGAILINEISPRIHNSGHQTVSANVTSQYEQQLRIALGLPLGSVKQISNCVLVNLLAEEATGPTDYHGLEEAYKIPNVQYVLYGKDSVRPNRKMGHALVLEEDTSEAIKKIDKIRKTLTITAYEQ